MGMSLSQSLPQVFNVNPEEVKVPSKLNIDQKDLDKSVSSVSVSHSGQKDLSGPSSLNFSSSTEYFSSSVNSDKSNLLAKIPLPDIDSNILTNLPKISEKRNDSEVNQRGYEKEFEFIKSTY